MPLESPTVTIKTPLKYNCAPNESPQMRTNELLLDRGFMSNIFSTGSLDKESNCCDKSIETYSPHKGSPQAQTPLDNPRTPPDDPREKRDPLLDIGLHSILTVIRDKLRPVRTGGASEMYSVVTSF